MNMKSYKKFIALGFLSLSLGSCSSSDQEESEALDLKVTKKSAQSAQVPPDHESNVAEEKQAKQAGSVQIGASAVVDWSKFFKAPPSTSQRKVISKRITAWSNSSDPETLVKKGRNEVSLGQIIAAEASFREALRYDENNLQALLGLSQLYLRKSDLPLTFEFLAQTRQRMNPDKPAASSFIFQYRYTLSMAYIAKGSRNKGHDILSDLIAIDPAFSPGYAALASSYLNIGKTKMAEFISKRGIDRGKKDPALFNLMGVINERMGRVSAARLWYNKALKISPAFAPALVNRANQSIRRYEYQAAEQDLLKAVESDPFNAEAFVSIGITQKKMGRITAARASFTKAMDINPDNASARFNLGVLMADNLKEYNTALRLFHEVLQTQSDNDKVKSLAKLYIEDIRENVIQ